MTDQRTDKPTGSSPSGGRLGMLRPGALPTRVRRMIHATGIVLAMGILVVIASAFIVNDMKNRLVELAHEEVRETMEAAADEIAQVVRDHEEQYGTEVNSLADIANNPTVKAQLRIMSRSTGALVMTAMIDHEGNCLYQHYGDNPIIDNCPIRRGNSGIIPTTGDGAEGGLTWELEVREYPAGSEPQTVAVTVGDRVLGHIEYVMEEGLTLSQIDPISSQITTSLTWMAILATLCIGAAILLVNRIWGKHLELETYHREAQHMANIGTMASGMAHEIRNPLHAMNLHLEAAREELEDPREHSTTIAARTIANVQRQIANLNGIVTNFMAYAMPNACESEPVRLACVMADVAHLLRPELDRRNVVLERNIPEEAWILGDYTAVSQVLTNIVLNAAQAVERSDERRIMVRARLDDSCHWIMTVEDTGPGLPPGKEESIFEVFVSERPGGSGFGLAIARRLMEQHGGSIKGTNRPEGGARFMLDFQATAPPEKSDRQTSAASRSGAVDGSPATIG